MSHDVVIVGAGIGGAVLALDLGRRGWRVALLERETAPLRLARPEILWDATPRALDRYGVADAIRDTASVRLQQIEIGGKAPWLRFTEADFAAAGIAGFSTDPGMTRALIAEAAAATGKVEIQRGVNVEGLLMEGGRVTGVRGRRGAAPFELAAQLVVGDDGGHSAVRAALAIPMTLRPFPVDFITAPVPRWPLPPRQVRGWINGGDDGPVAAVLIPWPGETGILLMPTPAARAERLLALAPDAFWDALAALTPMAGELRGQLEFPRDFRRIARPFGHAASYVADGAALIGDAIHSMTPAGGQGANASIWDALALAEVADAALRAGGATRERLLPYERRRRAANARSIGFSRMARRAFTAGRFLPVSFGLPLIMKTVNVLGWPKRRLFRTFATAFIHQT